ncbi:MAG TPA: DUF1572 domain-containing protein [Bacteroidia bacterium]
MQNDFLESARKQFEMYKLLGEKTFAQLSDEQLYWKYNEESNSIATIVKHLSGNMLSRWTDFLTTDGEKDWRNRESEFDNDVKDKQALIASWNKGWDCLFKALNTINKDNFNTTIYIRHQAHSVTGAINRQLAHYAYHIGQIVFIGKMMKDDKWTSLSIPRAKTQK